MAFANMETKEINCKVLYFGAKGAGKSTNFQTIYRQSQSRLSDDSFVLEKDQVPFFEFIPISLGHLKDFHIKLHLYTLPSNPLLESVSTVMLKGIDGFVFVFDSRLSAMDENISHWHKVKEILSREGHNMITLPRVLQYNKRDHSEAVSLPILRKELNPGGSVDIEASALNAMGIMETLQQISKQVLDSLAKGS